jgi:hypothetical protein
VPVRLEALLDRLSGLLEVVRVGREPVEVTSVRFVDNDSRRDAVNALLLAAGTADDPAARASIAQHERSGAAAIVFRAGVLQGRLPEGDLTLLAADPSLDWGQVHALAQAGLQAGGVRLRDFDDAPDLFGVANVVAAALGGAVLVEDAEMTALAYSTVDGQQIDHVREAGILHRKVPRTEYTQDGYRAVARSIEPVRFPATADRLGRLAIALRAGGEVLGSMWVIDPGPAADAEALQVLVDAAQLASFHMLDDRTRRAAAASASAADAARLLRGTGSAANAARWARTSTTTVVVAIAARQEQDDASHHWPNRASSSLRAYLSAYRVQHLLAVEGDRVYLVVGFGEARRNDVMRTVQGVVGHLERSTHAPVTAAVGSPVEAVSAIPQSRAEADELLDLLLARPGLPSVARYEATISQLLLRRLVGNGSAMRLLEDTRFQRLRDYDRDNGSAYIPTLATYLDALGDAVSTAATCGVHANTVRHRMRRVEELLDVDLSDPDDRLVLWLQLRLHSAASLSDGPPGVASPALVQRP